MISKASVILAFLASVAGPFLPRASAQTAAFTTLSPFSGYSDGRSPSGTMVEGNDGNYYGTTGLGGAYGYTYEGYDAGYGTVYKLTPAGAVTTLHSFDGTDGTYPVGLTKGLDGNFYGATQPIGLPGTIFKITPAGVFTTLYTFSPRGAQGENADGYTPVGVTQAADGNFYGVTELGGAYGSGTIFQLTPGGTLTTLHSFSAPGTYNDNADGWHPVANLIQGANGDLYGSTQYGGTNDDGVIFQITTAGFFSVLHSFAGGSDGNNPTSALAQGSDGNFYGSNLAGKFFQITPAGVVTELHAVALTNESVISSLTLGGDGAFYGTIAGDSSVPAGTIFKITTAGAYTALYQFTSASNGARNDGGSGPYAPLLLGSDGNFYGSAADGGAFGAGTLFKFPPGGTPTTLHDFSTANPAGAEPSSGLLLGADGNLYGTAQFGGANGQGTAFRVTPTGALSALYSFSSSDSGGYAPEASLILGPGGDFFGTTFSGGANALGTVFQLTPDGALSTLASFSTYNGTGSDSPLALGADGNFYGTTSDSYPSVFKVTPAGAITSIYGFSGTNLDIPNSGLTLGSDGNFYGSTLAAIYKITPAGQRTTLYSFPDYANDRGANVGLIQGTDGNFYGVTGYGGTNNTGTVYRLTPTGTLTTLHSFSAFENSNDANPNSDGGEPQAGLVQGSDGNFYGTANLGGAYAEGTVFQITPAGVFTNLHNFTAYDSGYDNTDGARPTSSLIEVGAGHFYGTAPFGGANGTGTIFELTVSPAITSATQATANQNDAFTYQITATNGPTSFAATGLPAGLSVNASGEITGKATAPGTFSVGLSATNAGGTGTATLSLTVRPPPAVTSATTASATEGKAFSYQITASNQPTSFGASGLPAGLTCSGTSGLISGTPTVAGTFSVELHATNTDGTGVETLTLTVAAAPPVVTSTDTASATEGKSFSYQITATNQPTSYGASGLPAGLTCSGTSGLISGTPTKAGSFSVDLHASNAKGTGVETLTLAVANPAPAITSASPASATVGKSFSYQITATNQPTSYGASGLPAGLTCSGSTGAISGTPTKSGSFSVALHASNASGTGQETLTLTVAAAGS